MSQESGRLLGRGVVAAGCFLPQASPACIPSGKSQCRYLLFATFQCGSPISWPLPRSCCPREDLSVALTEAASMAGH